MYSLQLWPKELQQCCIGVQVQSHTSCHLHGYKVFHNMQCHNTTQLRLLEGGLNVIQSHTLYDLSSQLSF